MSLKIDQDYGRFRNIVRGKIREGLRRLQEHNLVDRYLQL